jgi:hypothetical protein
VVVGAGTPEQVTENAKAAGVRLDLDVLTRVDHLLGSFVQTDPRLVWSPRRSSPGPSSPRAANDSFGTSEVRNESFATSRLARR